jgi:hypothetical protein
LVLRNVRQLTLTGFLHPREQPEPESTDLTPGWNPVVQLVKKATHLTKFNYHLRNAPFPLILLEALQTYHPGVKLYIWSHDRHEELDHTDAAEQALAVSPILRGIKAEVWTNGGGTGFDLRTAAFRRIVANAPNLEFASIIQGHSGCVIRCQEPEEYAREQEAADKFFLDLRGPNTSVRKFTLDVFRLGKDMLTEWGKYVSLSHLEDLKCSRGFPDKSYFEAAPALLSNLKHVSLNLSQASRHPDLPPLVDDYLATCASLETLSLWSWMGVVSLDTILKHGPTLKKLELHEREAWDMGSRRGLLSVEDVRRIRKECPLLEDLTLDMDRQDADWRKVIDHHKEILQEIAQFGKGLRRVQIYLDLGISVKIFGPATASRVQGTNSQGQERKVQSGEKKADAAADHEADSSAEHVYKGPFLPPSRADMHKHGERVWEIIFGDPKHTGDRKLDIKWGEWERKMGGGYPADWVLWEQEKKRCVSVRPEVRDDKPGEAIVHIYGGYGKDDD